MDNQTHIWHELWLFGIVIDDDLHLEPLTGFYVDQDQPGRAAYYVPDDYDTTVSLVCLDGPQRSDSPSLRQIADWMEGAPCTA